MTKGSRGRRGAWIAAAVLVVIIAAAWAIGGVGQWLVVQDALEPAQAIVVLSGRMPVRAREAAEIYREGFAAQVWITRPASPEEELRQMGIGFVRSEEHTSELQSRPHLVCRLLLAKKKYTVPHVLSPHH